jgi:hypothetical protein
MLDDLEAQGWSPDQHVQVTNLANAPEIFTVSPVVEWVGSPEAMPDYYRMDGE